MSVFNRIFKKKEKNNNNLPNAIVFVDYEHWYIGFDNKFHTVPDIESWYESLKKKCNISKVMFFANFSAFDHKEEEVKKIRAFSNKIIDTFNPDLVSVKDYTDFIILDNIYQSVLDNDKNDMYIIFSGDGHFSSVVSYLKNIKRKEVGIYGVKGCISKNLYSAASWVEEVAVRNNKPANIEDAVFTCLYKLKETPNIVPTFSKTVSSVAYKYKYKEYLVKNTLKSLINEGYISQESLKLDEKGEIRALIVNWKKVFLDNKWFNSQK